MYSSTHVHAAHPAGQIQDPVARVNPRCGRSAPEPSLQNRESRTFHLSKMSIDFYIQNGTDPSLRFSFTDGAPRAAWDKLCKSKGLALPQGLEVLILPRAALPEPLRVAIQGLMSLTRLVCLDTGFYPSLSLSSLQVGLPSTGQG